MVKSPNENVKSNAVMGLGNLITQNTVQDHIKIYEPIGPILNELSLSNNSNITFMKNCVWAVLNYVREFPMLKLNVFKQIIVIFTEISKLLFTINDEETMIDILWSFNYLM